MREINYAMLPQHMIGSVKMYIEEGLQPGDFLTAVLENNLTRAYAHADEINSLYMRIWVQFMCNEAPAGCWGSPESVEWWISQRRKERQENN